MNKRGIALFIILSLLLTTVLVSAAGPMTDIENNPYRSDIEQMVEMGILSGRANGQFDPDANLTRAEAAKVAMYLAGFDENDAAAAANLPQAFDDVYPGLQYHGWALGWINLAAKEGIIEGKGNNKYAPGDNLKMVEWATILMRILGYDTKGLAWPTGYDQMVKGLGLTQALNYQSGSFIKRDQMAKFSVNAIEHEYQDDPDFIDKSLNISLKFSSQILAEGGGKTSTITVTVTDQLGRPVDDAEVWFAADAFEGPKVADRKAQLSKTKTTTDASGKAVVTYTSLAKDDKKLVNIEASAGKDYMDVHSGPYALIAANQAAIITGVVRNPYTGVPIEGVHMHFETTKNRQGIGGTVTNSQGRYSVPVPVGTYYIAFEKPEMPIRDEITVKATTAGKTVTANNNKGILRGVVKGLAPGREVIVVGRGVANGWTLIAKVQKDGSFAMALEPSTYEIFVLGRSNPFKTGIKIKAGQINDMGTVTIR